MIKISKIDLPIPELTKELLIKKGIDTTEKATKFLYPNINDLYDYNKVDGLNAAIDLYIKHLNNKSNILYYGDYDVDGCCASAILALGLTNLVKIHGGKSKIKLPTRVEGYGMNVDAIKTILKTYKIDLIVTVDNGIKGVDEIAFCKKQGIDVIVLDHHTPDMSNLPKANCLVDLHMTGTKYPFKHLCGASLAFKFVMGVCDKMNQPLGRVFNLLQYAAVATIADVVPLTDENRLIVQLGLDILNKSPAPGFKALCDALRVSGQITAETINYQIAPCINAPGRIYVPTLSLQLLIEQNYDKALIKANEVVSINERRKELTEIYYNKGIEYLKDYMDDYVYIIKVDGCPEGIIGLVAGRIKEEFNKPTIVLTKHHDNFVGSCRSIPKFNINEELTRQKDLLLRFGGHTLAAGLSLKEEQIDRLRQGLNKRALELLSENDFIREYNILDKITTNDIPEYFYAISLLEPFGQDNPRPIFKIDFKGLAPKWKEHGEVYDVLKDKHIKIYGPNRINALGFSLLEKYKNLNYPKDLSLIGHLTTNTYNGYTNHQINILDFTE